MSNETEDGAVHMKGTMASSPSEAPSKNLELPTPKKLSMPYTLPSNGVFYGDALPNGKVTISPIKGEQEEILSGMGDPSTAKKTLQHIVEQLVDLGDMSIQKMLVGDYQALVMNLMAFSYDPYISATTQCNACRKTNQFHKAIFELECTTLSKETVSNPENYTVRFDSVEAEIEFRSLTIEDAEDIEQFARSHRAEAEARGSKPEYLYTFVKHIVSINGKDAQAFGVSKLRHWLGQLSGKDMTKLRDALNRVETGYNMKPTITCNHCGNNYEVPLPEVSTFFRNKSTKAKRS